VVEVIIIGGGPAGLSCAIWLKKLGVEVLVLEASGELGGLQTLSPYENLWIPGVQGRTGQEVARSLGQHALDLGVEVRLDTRVHTVGDDGRTVVSSQASFSCSYLVLATGTRPRNGGFAPARHIAIGPGTPMEMLAVQGRRIAILGGGDNAFDQARFVRDRGGDVTIFTRSKPRAQTLLQGLIPQVRVMVGPYEVETDPLRVGGEVFDALGVMFGFEAVLPLGLNLALLEGYVVVDRAGETSLDNVFACGELTNYWHPCVTTACAHGIQVAKQISQRLGR